MGKEINCETVSERVEKKRGKNLMRELGGRALAFVLYTHYDLIQVGYVQPNAE